MIVLTNAVVPFDGDPIIINKADSIKDFTVDHSLANDDCTKVILDDGTVYQVQESIEEIQAMIEAE